MNNLKQAFYVFCTLFYATIQPEPTIVVFDLGGVLFESKTPISLLLKHFGLKKTLKYMLNPYTKKSNLKKMALAFLDTIKARPDDAGTVDIPTDQDGNPLPLLMEEWLSGSLSGNDIISLIKETAANNPSLFSCSAEKKILLKIVRLIFDPALFIETQHLHSDAVQSVQQLKDAGFQVYALSNWDKESFMHMEKKYHDFFSLFDGVMISASQGAVKPSLTLYKAFLNHYELEPDSCIFIDDQKVNVLSAKKIGMHAFICPYTKTILTQRKANLILACKAIQKIKKAALIQLNRKP